MNTPRESLRRMLRDYSRMGLVVAALIMVASPWVGIWRMRPPLAKQYDRLCAAVYLFYVETGELPNAADLSEPFQELIAEDNGITYTRQDGAAYRLERPYPLNIPMVGLVTFGQFWGGEGVVIAWKQRPNDIVYNANPRARR